MTHITYFIPYRNNPMPSPSLSIGNLMGTVAILLEEVAMMMMMMIQTTEVLLLVEVEISLIGVLSNSSSGIWIMPFHWTRPSLDRH